MAARVRRAVGLVIDDREADRIVDLLVAVPDLEVLEVSGRDITAGLVRTISVSRSDLDPPDPVEARPLP